MFLKSQRQPRPPGGFNLIELMIGLAVGLGMLAAVLTVILRLGVAGSEAVRGARLTQETRQILDIIAKDLQRAGSVDWITIWDPTDASVNDPNGDLEVNFLDFFEGAAPAIELFGQVSMFRFPTAGDPASGSPVSCPNPDAVPPLLDCDCILYSYDRNGDGAQGVGSAGTPGPMQNTANVEQFGIRWNGTAIETRVGGATYSCDSPSWEDLTTADIRVTRLAFNMAWLPTGTSVTAADLDDLDIALYAVSGEGDWDGSYRRPGECTPVDTDATDAAPLPADTACLQRRLVSIELDAELDTDAGVQVRFRTDAKIHNDLLNL